MILGLLVIFVFAIIIWTYGNAFLLIFKIDKDIYWLSLPCGLALIAVFTNYMYFSFSLSIEQCKNILLCGFIILFIYIVIVIYRKRNINILYPLIYSLAIFFILMIPAIIGGKSFYISGIGFWDDFSYMSLALLFEKFDYQFINSHSVYELAEINDILADVIKVSPRPSAPLLFSLIVSNHIGDFFALAYEYIAFGLSLAALPFCWIGSKLKKRGSSRIYLLMIIIWPVSYVIGFWGQLMFDLRVWSCIMSLGIIYCIAFLFCQKDKELLIGKQNILSYYVLLVLLISGAMLIYPEHTMYIGMAIGMLCIFDCIRYRKEISIKKFFLILGIPVVSLIIAIIPNYEAIFSFIFTQLSFAMGKVNRTDGWESTFFNYVKGLISIDNKVLEILNRLPSLIGMYFITPNYYRSIVIIVLQLILIIIVNLLIILYFIYTTKNVITKTSDRMLSGVYFLLIIETIPMILFLFSGKLWNLGRAMQYSSGLLFFLLGYQLFQSRNESFNKLLRIFSLLFLVTNLSFFVLKNTSAIYGKPQSIKENYISIYQQNDCFEWNIDNKLFKNYQCVMIDADQDIEGLQFYVWYIKLLLTYENKDFTMKQPLNGMQTQELNNYKITKDYDGIIKIIVNSDNKYDISVNDIYREELW